MTRRGGGRFYDWPAILSRARAAPGRWVLAVGDAPASLVKHIRKRRSPELESVEGSIEVQLVNPYSDANDNRRGAVYIRLTPAPQSE